jgi:hypothetical protein
MISTDTTPFATGLDHAREAVDRAQRDRSRHGH